MKQKLSWQEKRSRHIIQVAKHIIRCKDLKIISVHLDCHITPINNSPLASVLYSSNNTLHRSQINHLFNAKFLVVIVFIR